MEHMESKNCSDCVEPNSISSCSFVETPHPAQHAFRMYGDIFQEQSDNALPISVGKWACDHTHSYLDGRLEEKKPETSESNNTVDRLVAEVISGSSRGFQPVGVINERILLDDASNTCEENPDTTANNYATLLEEDNVYGLSSGHHIMGVEDQDNLQAIAGYCNRPQNVMCVSEFGKVSWCQDLNKMKLFNEQNSYDMTCIPTPITNSTDMHKPKLSYSDMKRYFNVFYEE